MKSAASFIGLMALLFLVGMGERLPAFVRQFRALNREGEYDVFDFGQFLARLEVTPYFRIPICEATEAIALNDRDFISRGI